MINLNWVNSIILIELKRHDESFNLEYKFICGVLGCHCFGCFVEYNKNG